ncbi:carbonic anhydrase [Vararia minispora EC-137]|uniref:Carbonic anhydrase n=1 Tax=Vararia minispora EC-137 TaxID=1314806 RepID=A0ACB8Q525_9AGAM|nr:carbonic anhydrase [Vararia minispora EC-137]
MVTTTTQEFAGPNEAYAQAYGDNGALAIPPARKLAIVTCMDARVDPAAALGLKLGDAHVIRNAGGVAADSIRSLVISQRLLGTREIALFHHTDCGMLTFSSDQLRGIVLKESGGVDVGDALAAVGSFHEFGDVEAAVKADVAFLKAHPLVLKETVVTGWVHQVETGKVRRIV